MNARHFTVTARPSDSRVELTTLINRYVGAPDVDYIENSDTFGPAISILRDNARPGGDLRINYANTERRNFFTIPTDRRTSVYNVAVTNRYIHVTPVF
jgi:hypothetical protein